MTQIPPPQLSPHEVAAYSTRRNQANRQYGQGLARNQFARQTYLGDFASRLRDLRRGFSQARNQMPYQANARGLLRSGIYKQGLSDYGADRQRAIADALRQRTSSLGGFTLDRNQAEETRAQLLADIAAQEAARRQQLAAQIRGAQ